jgi:hypothetical protein
MGSAILPARPENYNEDKFRFEFKTFGARKQALKLSERAGGIKGLELDRDVETRDKARAGSHPCTCGERKARRRCYGCRWRLDCPMVASYLLVQAN